MGTPWLPWTISFAFSTATSAPPVAVVAPPRFLSPVAWGPRASSRSERSLSISLRASLSFSESEVVVARDCSKEALVGETPALLMSATDSAGRAGSADLGVGVERSLAIAGPAVPEGGVEVGRGVLLIPFPLAAVGLEWAGAKIAYGSASPSPLPEV